MFVPFVVGTLAKRLPRRFAIAVAVISVLAALPYTKPTTYEPRDDNYYLSRREFTDGTSSLGNSMSTRWTPWKRSRANQKIEIIEGDGSIQRNELEPTKYGFTIDAQSPITVRLNTVYFPGWEARFDNQWQPLESDSDGLMRMWLPAGRTQIQVELHNSGLRQVALIISLVSFIWLLGSGILKK